MALKVELKPGERIIIGRSMITNDHQRTRLFIEGDAPILREKDILTPDSANTPAKRLYLSIQLMYLSEDVSRFQDDFFALSKDIVVAAPSSTRFIAEIGNLILSGSLYKAMKEARQLIEHERKLIDHVQSGGAGLSENPPDNCHPTRTRSDTADEGSRSLAERS
jgi:flagellar protein FlbT